MVARFEQKWRIKPRILLSSWPRVVARGNLLEDDLSVFCTSRAAGSSGNAISLKWSLDLYEYECESRGSLLDLWPAGLPLQWPFWQGRSWVWTCRSWGGWWAISFYLHDWISSFISRLGAVFFDFDCIWVAKSDFEYFGGSISPFVFVCYHKNFLYKLTRVCIKLCKQSPIDSMILWVKRNYTGNYVFFFF